jgi:hypothetical protein
MAVKLGATEPFTSSYTVTNACVEVGSSAPTSVEVSDSKFNHTAAGRAAKTAMRLSPGAFTSLVAFAKADQTVTA